MSSETARQLRTELTSDGSLTVVHPDTGSTYHSRHGAKAESMHVFIEAGLRHVVSQGKKHISILEMGLGTGLNLLLTVREADALHLKIDYVALEAHPLPSHIWQTLAAHEDSESEIMQLIHHAPWGEVRELSGSLRLTKHHCMLQEFETGQKFDVIYYDAFEPNTQPELWTEEIFRQLAGMMHPGGVLVTYCAKGAVRRAMQATGLMVERLPGPPFKREMLRATMPVGC